MADTYTITAADRVLNGEGHINVQQALCPDLWAATTALPGGGTYDRLLPVGAATVYQGDDMIYRLPDGRTFSQSKCYGTYEGGTVAAGASLQGIGQIALVAVVFYLVYTFTRGK